MGNNLWSGIKLSPKMEQLHACKYKNVFIDSNVLYTIFCRFKLKLTILNHASENLLLYCIQFLVSLLQKAIDFSPKIKSFLPLYRGKKKTIVETGPLF